MTAPVNRRLSRDVQHKMIGGVCAGLARRLGISRGAVRLAFVLSCILPGPQVVAYLVLWLVMPADY
jgi:phage shock protein PspC (stress-responsive transcriptional regulator)